MAQLLSTEEIKARTDKARALALTAEAFAAGELPMHQLYNSRWEKLRRAHLAQFPNCVYCYLHHRLINDAQVVDHIVPHNRNLVLYYSPDNLQSLCFDCHNGRKQSEEKSATPNFHGRIGALSLTMGLPGSGKSTYVRTFRTADIFSFDDIRERLTGSREWTRDAHRQTMGHVFETISASQSSAPIVIDATGLAPSFRAAFLRLAEKINRYPELLIFECAPQIALARIVQRESKARAKRIGQQFEHMQNQFMIAKGAAIAEGWRTIRKIKTDSTPTQCSVVRVLADDGYPPPCDDDGYPTDREW